MTEEYIDLENETPEEREERELESLDTFLAGLEPGYTLVISRVEPVRYKGLLEEIAVTEMSNPISINYLINKWGGHKLRLRFRRPNGKWAKHRDVDLYTFQPLIFGNPIPDDAQIQNPHIHQFVKKEQSTDTQIVPATPAVQDPKESQSTLQMMELLKMMQAMRAADMQAMAAMMQTQNRDVPPPADPYKMLSHAFSLFSQFQGLRLPAAGETSENDQIIGLLGKLAEAFGQTRQTVPDTRLTPPRNEPITAPVNGTGQSRPIHEALSGLGPKSVDAFRQAVADMDAETQAETMNELLRSIDQVGGRELLLQSLEQRGILDYDDDVDEGSSEGDENEDTGGEPRPNA